MRKLRTRLLLVPVALLGIVAVFVLFTRPQSTGPAAAPAGAPFAEVPPSDGLHPAAAPVETVGGEAAAEPEPELPFENPSPLERNRRETARMVAAHAPLREPAVADPDSQQNKEILHKMMLNAFSRLEPNPAPSSPQ